MEKCSLVREIVFLLEVRRPRVNHGSILWKFLLNFFYTIGRWVSYNLKNVSEKLVKESCGSFRLRTLSQLCVLRESLKLRKLVSEKGRQLIFLGLSDFFWKSIRKSRGKWSESCETIIEVSEKFELELEMM